MRRVLALSMLLILGVHFWLIRRADVVQERLSSLNDNYLPIVRDLGVLSGKWAVYQSWFDRAASSIEHRRLSRMNLQKMVEKSLDDLHFRAESTRRNASDQDQVARMLLTLVTELRSASRQAPRVLDEVEQGHKEEVAAARAQYASLFERIDSTSEGVASRIEILQAEVNHELNQFIAVGTVIFISTLLVFVLLMVQVRRWFSPIFAWTNVARSIAKDGLSKRHQFPENISGMPKELQILTGEFQKMAVTLMEREKSVQQQNAKKLRKEEEKRLLVAETMSSQIAHELRNPLNSMAIQLDLLMEDLELIPGAKPSGVQGRITAITQQVDRLERLTKNYLNLEKKGTSTESIADMRMVLERCLEFCGPEFQRDQIKVHLLLKGDEPYFVAGGADEISQIVFNLIRNSSEALRDCQTDRQITIAQGEETVDLMSRWTFSDNGSGVPRGQIPRLFEPFATSKSDGQGLGLSLARRIARNCGGDLLYMPSESGAVFELVLPIASSVSSGIHTTFSTMQEYKPESSC